MARISKPQLITLQKTLKTDLKIGQKFGISRQAVHQLREKYGIPALMGKHAERNQGIVKAFKAGMSGEAVAKKFKLSDSQTYRIFKSSLKAKKGTAAIGTWPTPEKPKKAAAKKKK